MRRVLTCLLAVVGLVTVYGTAKASPIGFSGPYSPGNWTLTNTNADGSVDWSGAPASTMILGGDNFSFAPGTTDLTNTARASGAVSFDWSYSTIDAPGWDGFGVLLNGAYTEIANANGQSGSYSFNVSGGDTFGFRIRTDDNFGGRGIATVTNFDAPTPEPMSLLVFGGLTVAGIAGYRRRQKKA